MLGRKIPGRVKNDVFGILGHDAVEVVLAAVGDHLLVVVVHAADDRNVEMAESHAKAASQADGRKPPNLRRTK